MRSNTRSNPSPPVGVEIRVGASVSSHQSNTPSESELTCLCGKLCKSIAGYKNHIKACKVFKFDQAQRQQDNEQGDSTTERQETTRSKTGLRSQFPCPECDTGFATQGGLSTHRAKVHPLEWNEYKLKRRQEDGPRQHTWVDGDFELICRGEIEYAQLSSTVKKMGINIYIRARYFPTLTVEAVKAQRKRKAFTNYKMERETSGLEREQANSRDQQATETQPEEEAPLEFTQLTKEEESEISKKLYGKEILKTQELLLAHRISAAAQAAIGLFESLAQQFQPLENKAKTVPESSKKGKASKTKGASKVGNQRRKQVPRLRPSKQKRKDLYAIVQKRWRGKRKKIVDQILAGNLNKARQPTHSTEKLDAYWRTLFNRESPLDNHERSEAHPPCPELARTIEKGEVEAALKKANDAAPGPDGVPLKHLKDIGATSLTILFNALFFAKRIPENWKVARTVLIPKADEPSSPAEYRPVSISSYYYRIYSSVISRRMSASIIISNRQRGFIKQDGIRDNLVLLETLIEDSKRTSSSLHLTFMDVRKAFDSVSHDSIRRALIWAGVPAVTREVILDLYRDCSTNVGGGRINVTRGVKQGDPLSSVLFNLVLEMALSNVPENLGVMYCKHRLFYMAFADDLVIVARSREALQELVNHASKELGHVGLELHPAKCKSLSIVADQKRKTTFVDKSQNIAIDGVDMPSMSATDWYKYLGVRVGCKGTPKGEYLDELMVLLERVSRAPLKPHQRIYTLKTHVLPRFQHRLMFEKVTDKCLKRLDIEIRKCVRSWLKLPKDTATVAFYTDVISGGLGLLCLKDRIPLLKRQRNERMRTSNDPLIQLLVDQEPTKSRLNNWKRRCKYRGSPYTDKQELGELYRQDLWTTCDGKGLYNPTKLRDNKSSVHQLDGPVTSLSAAQYIGAIGTRLNTLATPLRKNRGRQAADRIMCDKGCSRRVASLGHISQVCMATHGQRVKRHDRIVKTLAKLFQGRESVTRVLVEPQLRPFQKAMLKPDLVVHTKDTIEIIDVQVKADQGCRRDPDEDQKVKVDKYSVVEYVDEAYKALGLSLPKSLPYKVSAFTITWRGQLAPHSIELANRLKFKTKLQYIVADALADTWAMFVTWNKTS